jgi:two-component system, cell cycle sensor histidine kinase and response regulator CckA
MALSCSPADAVQRDRSRQTLTEQVRLLYSNANIGVGITLLATVILGRLQWGAVPHLVILDWCVYMFLVSAARFSLARLYWLAGPSSQETSSWATAFTIGAGLAGVGWGAAGVLLYQEAHLANQVLLLFILGGMMLGAVSLLAPLTKAYLAFIVPTGFVPAIYLVVRADEAHVSMGLMASLFTVATLITTKQIHRTILSSLNSQFERQQAEDTLRESEERFRLAVEATNDAVWDIDLVTGTVRWNETYARLYGRPPETSKSWQWWIDRIHPEDRERTSGGLRAAVSGSGTNWTCEYRFQRVDGTWAYLHDRAYIARDPSGKAWRVIGAMQDLTQRKQAEAELRESEERFRNIADSAPVVVWTCGPDGAVTFTNRFGLNLFGRTMEQIQGMGWADLLHPDDSERVASEFSAAAASRQMYQHSFRIRRADGEYRWVVARGAPRFAGDVYTGHIGITTDITELKQSHEQLQAAQKLESLGALAGGIAHDFNNLLGGILAEAELVETDLAVGAEPREEIQRIKMAAIRGSEIVRELMIYAGENRKDLNEAVDVSRLVEEMLKLLKVSISKQVALRADFPGDLPAVWGNAPQIRQIVMNLVLNASEAIGDTKGVIAVTAAQVSGGRDLAPNNAMDIIPGEYVRVEVSDTGCGMTEEEKAKIFDPFFSTKFAGRGLGLAVVQGIVRDLGGAINILSAPGQGTAFQVLLPCAPKGALEIHGTIASTEIEKSNVNARTILVVEDDETLRRAVSKGLQKRGFSVIEASDGSVALDLIHAHKDEVDVVLLDVTLPGASSREVFEEVLRIRPDLKVIVTSAYDKEMVDAYYSGLRVNHFIRKPFHLDDLVRLSGTALSAKAR